MLQSSRRIRCVATRSFVNTKQTKHPWLQPAFNAQQLGKHTPCFHSFSSSSSPPSTTNGTVVVDDLPKNKNEGNSSVDKEESSSSFKKKKTLPMPILSAKNNEFPSLSQFDKRRQQLHLDMAIMSRQLGMALNRVLEPPTLHLLAASASATLMVGIIEGAIITNDWPFLFSSENCWDTTMFVMRYSLEQIFPSVVWQTQDPILVAIALGLDPSQILRDLSGNNPESASLLLKTNLLASSRSFFAGFMMIAQLVRAASITTDAFSEYQQRIRLGQEPPIVLPALQQSQQKQQQGLVVRLCGRDSFVTEVSMKTMGIQYIFPVFEDPKRIQNLVWQYSHNNWRPVYWHVLPGSYGSSFSWSSSQESAGGFPASKSCLFSGVSRDDKILILEADATNGNDPLTLESGDNGVALDLTIDDASQGFRRILDKYESKGLIVGRDFRTLRVYLGNSMEIFKTGGGHSYTLRHRFRYAKEFDVLLDSRVPILQKILEWCESVCASQDNDRKQLFFQTSSRKYFVNLKGILKEYGYEVLDPLDLRMLDTLRQDQQQEQEVKAPEEDGDAATKPPSSSSLMSILLDDQEEHHGMFLEHFFSMQQMKECHKKEQSPSRNKREMLRMVAKMSKLPRLVHMANTSQTVNTVEALIAAGEILQGGGCCALVDRQEGVQALERTLIRTSDFVEGYRHQWKPKTENEGQNVATIATKTTTTTANNTSRNGLQIICSSSIHDDLFRQIRLRAKMGYSASDIQKEVDTQFKEVLNKSYNAIQQEKVETTAVHLEDKCTLGSDQDGDKSHDEKESHLEIPPPQHN